MSPIKTLRKYAENKNSEVQHYLTSLSRSPRIFYDDSYHQELQLDGAISSVHSSQPFRGARQHKRQHLQESTPPCSIAPRPARHGRCSSIAHAHGWFLYTSRGSPRVVLKGRDISHEQAVAPGGVRSPWDPGRKALEQPDSARCPPNGMAWHPSVRISILTSLTIERVSQRDAAAQRPTSATGVDCSAHL